MQAHMSEFVITKDSSVGTHLYESSRRPVVPLLGREGRDRSPSRSKSEIPTKAGRRGWSTTQRSRRLVEGISCKISVAFVRLPK